MFKVIIAGGRNFCHYAYLAEECDKLLRNKEKEEVEIVSGDAQGADKCGNLYAQERGIALKKFLPDWKNNGKAAGMIRNKEMAEYADAAIVFWDGESPGSKNMIETMKTMGKPVRVVRYRKVNK